MHFKIKRTTQLKKLKTAYCDRQVSSAKEGAMNFFVIIPVIKALPIAKMCFYDLLSGRWIKAIPIAKKCSYFGSKI